MPNFKRFRRFPLPFVTHQNWTKVPKFRLMMRDIMNLPAENNHAPEEFAYCHLFN
jgi:hypothetical protein